MSKLNDLLIKCNKYTSDMSYVYKLCNDAETKKPLDKKKEWLVILQKPDNVKTNEARSNVVDSNKKHAKFRANEMIVIEIINIRTDIHTPDGSSTKMCVVN